MAINKRKILESAQKNLQKGLIDKALVDYRTLLRADPHDSNVLLKVGDLYLKQGKREDSINAYLRVAQQFTREGFDAKAVALYKQISRLDPKRHDVCVPLAELYSRMGLIGDAIASLQTAADAAYRDGDKDDALELLRRMAALDPSNTPNRLKVAELLGQEGRKSEALADYEAVAEELERRGEEEERIRVVERILALDPERAPALREVARAKLAMNQFAAAQKLAEQLIAAHADDVDGYELLGHALLGAGEAERAREVFRDLADRFRLRGDEGRARDLMQRFGGVEALSADETEAPLEAEEGVLELDREIGTEDFLLEEEPGASAPAFESSTTVETPETESPQATPIGKIEPVQVLAAKPEAVVQAPESTPVPEQGQTPTSDPEQLLAEATVYLRYGKHERAVAALREILAREPDHRAALEHLAEALSAHGDPSNAVTAWQRAAEAARDAGDGEDFERLRTRLSELDAEAADALGGPHPTSDGPPPMSDEAEVDLDFDLDGEPAPSADAALETRESSQLEAPEIEFSDELDGLEEIPEEIEPPAPDTAPDDEPERTALPAVQPESAPAPPDDDPTAPTPAQLSEQLEEAEFYLEQGLLDEARDLYERILEAAPSQPQAMLRLGEIEARSGGAIPDIGVPEQTSLSSASEPHSQIETEQALALEPEPETAPAPQIEAESADDVAAEVGDDAAAEQADDVAAEPVDRVAAGPVDRVAAEQADNVAADTAEEPGDFDLAAELAFGIQTDEPKGGTLAGTEEEGFEQVFNAFKSGVERELGDGDQEARYDLGIAYKEMGLLEDAIGEFRIAMQVEGRRLSSLHMMGICALELGRGADAVAHLEQALSVPDLPTEQCVPLRYDLGRAYGAQGDVERARAAFEEVRRLDPDFGDVERELAALETCPEPAATSGDEENGEAYESFDDLLAERPQEPAEPRYESFDDLFAESAEEAESETEPEPELAPEPTAVAPESIAVADETDAESVVTMDAPLDESEVGEGAAEPDPTPEPEPQGGPDVPSDLPSDESSEAPEAPAEPPPKRKRRKISFV